MFKIRTFSQWLCVIVRFIEMEPPIVPVIEVFFLWHMISVIFICKNIPCSTNFFISIVFNHSSKENVISQESVMDSFIVFLLASLFQIVGQIIFSTSWKFAISVAVKSSLLYDIFWNWKNVQCIFNETSIGHCFCKEMPACAKDDAFTPVW